jgi:2-polyprenyl-3-methyl-5-hydroxy-6-metoxy-1,4-benzoquinol methylase
VVYLAQQGFEVYGLDNSPNGLELTQRWLSEAGLSAELHLQDMTEPLPYEDQFFDGLISTQVIHHGRLTTVKAIVAEIERVLKPGGLVFISVPAEKNQAETFEEIEPHTFIPLDGPEKGLPHYYFTPETLREAFENFDVFDIQLDNVTHYCLWGQKKIATELLFSFGRCYTIDYAI